MTEGTVQVLAAQAAGEKPAAEQRLTETVLQDFRVNTQEFFLHSRDLENKDSFKKIMVIFFERCKPRSPLNNFEKFSEAGVELATSSALQKQRRLVSEAVDAIA